MRNFILLFLIFLSTIICSQIKSRHRLRFKLKEQPYDPVINGPYNPNNTFEQDFGPNGALMKWDLFKDDVPSDYFDINSPEEYEEAFERDITNEYWSNRSHKDDEFYEKHKKDFEKVVDYQ